MILIFGEGIFLRDKGSLIPAFARIYGLFYNKIHFILRLNMGESERGILIHRK
jgi:hypothetical protein